MFRQTLRCFRSLHPSHSTAFARPLLSQLWLALSLCPSSCGTSLYSASGGRASFEDPVAAAHMVTAHVHTRFRVTWSGACKATRLGSSFARAFLIQCVCVCLHLRSKSETAVILFPCDFTAMYSTRSGFSELKWRVITFAAKVEALQRNYISKFKKDTLKKAGKHRMAHSKVNETWNTLQTNILPC